VNEKDLKSLFISSVKSDHIDNNHFLPTCASINRDIIIKEEGYFRNFDLIIAVIEKSNTCSVNFDSIEAYDNYLNILMRTGILAEFAKSEKCRIDWIRFYAVELKSDNDVLDERLAHQILNAIFTFGRSVIVLDEKHSRRAKVQRTLKLIPATIIGYTGKDDRFEILSVFDRLLTNSMFNIEKRKLTKLLIDNGINKNTDKIYRCFANIQRINQKLAFSQLYNENLRFIKEEIEFIQSLVNIPNFSEKKQIIDLIKQTTNTKITDYL
jgi:hypothetical protein